MTEVAQVEPAAGAPSRPIRRSRAVLAVVFVIACALHLYAWYVHPDRPSLTNDAITGWYGGTADQINYMLEARALAEGQLPGTYWDYDRSQPKVRPPRGAIRSDYAYGLGYPILGAPFVKLGLRRDPFVIVDTIAFGLIICMAVLLARRFITDAAALVFAGMLAVASPMLRFTVMPWNTTITVLAVLAALLFATSDRRNWRIAVGLGFILSLCYAARFTDVVWAGAIVAAGLVPRTGADIRRNAAACAIVCAMLAVTYVAVGVTQKRVFGNFFTNPYHYHLHNGVRGNSLADVRLRQVPRAFTEVFVTASSGPRRVWEPHTSVLRAFPWVIAAPFGLVLLVQRRHPHRWVVLTAATASVAASVGYLAYWSGTGADLENNNLRFFDPWFPFWGLLAAIALAELVADGARALANTSPAAQAPTGRSWVCWALAIASVPALLIVLPYVTAQTPFEIDLVRAFGEAEKRPLSAGTETFAIKDASLGGDVRHAILARAPTRLTWRITIPDHATLETAVGVDEEAWGKDGDGVVFVVAMSDSEGYRELLTRHVDPRNVVGDRHWLSLKIDLERFSGRSVSLILSTNTSLPGRASDLRNDVAYWAAPRISGYLP